LIVSFSVSAAQFSIWTKEFADSLVGQQFKARVGEKIIGIGEVLSAEVSADSLFMHITAEWPNDPISKKILNVKFPEYKIEQE
jgi:hypothetical protein